MPVSPPVRKFIESLPPEELFFDVELLRSLARKAQRLAEVEPQLAAHFTLVRDGFAALANQWESLPLDIGVSQAITPPIITAVVMALEDPGTAMLLDELARVLAWARSCASEVPEDTRTMEVEWPTLKTCPHCGGKARMHPVKDSRDFVILCDGCRLWHVSLKPIHESIAQVVVNALGEAWNRRVGDPR